MPSFGFVDVFDTSHHNRYEDMIYRRATQSMFSCWFSLGSAVKDDVVATVGQWLDELKVLS